MTKSAWLKYLTFVVALLTLASLATVPYEATARKKYRYGQRYKKKNRKKKNYGLCVPCVGKNRHCEKQISDLHCKACNAYREAFSDYNKYKRRDPAVAWAAIVEVNRTAIARSESGLFPGGVCSVIHQKGQFSWTYCPKTCVSDRDWAIVMKAAADAKTSNGKLNYHAAYVSPSWSWHCRGKNRIGTHIYYDNCTGGKVRGTPRKRETRRKTIFDFFAPRTER